MEIRQPQPLSMSQLRRLKAYYWALQEVCMRHELYVATTVEKIRSQQHLRYEDAIDDLESILNRSIETRVWQAEALQLLEGTGKKYHEYQESGVTAHSESGRPHC